MLNHDSDESIGSLSGKLHISKNKIERAINLLKNQQFLTVADKAFKYYKLDPEITRCIESREDVEKLIHRELTTPDEIMQAHAEAMNPNHAAISLDGEPLLYPNISGLVEEFRNRNMTTFIVTNGTLPHVINNMDSLPTQLYVTLPAPNEHLYKKVCRPMVKQGWDNLMKTLDHLSSLSCRTLVRLTAVKNLNLNEGLIEEYVKLIQKTNPHFFEIKGFTLQAKALLIRDRMKENKSIQYYFPEYDYLEQIALKFEEIGNFPLIYTNKASRDFLFAVNWDENTSPKILHP